MSAVLDPREGGSPRPLQQRGSTTFWSHAKYVLSDNPVTLLAAGLFAAFVLVALAGPWIAPYDPLASNVGPALQPPTGLSEAPLQPPGG